jgi:hypothetical protein
MDEECFNPEELAIRKEKILSLKKVTKNKYTLVFDIIDICIKIVDPSMHAYPMGSG